VELRDDELLLRPVAEADAPAIAGACRDPEIPRYIPFVPSPYTEEHARAFVRDVADRWLTTPERTFAIVDAASDELLGLVTVRLREEGSVGYWLKREARGRGVTTRAVKLVVDWARREHGIASLRLTTHPENIASQRVAEKAGFRRIGTTTDHPVFSDGTREAVLFELRD
jgi:RimJ/RimL family protein N-acetyltransferase